MRVDKFLKISRVIKRRTVAKQACDQGRVMVNDKVAKAGTEVDIGDVVQITFGNKELKIVIQKITESCKKQDSEGMYDVIN